MWANVSREDTSDLCWLQLEIYEMIGQAISNSRRAGGEVSALNAFIE